MNGLLDFFANNYIWFIVGIVVIILALIGRYADKTNFGQNKDDNLIEDNKTETTPTESIQENTDDEVAKENSFDIIENRKLEEESTVYNMDDINKSSKNNSEYVYYDSNQVSKPETIYSINSNNNKEIETPSNNGEIEKVEVPNNNKNNVEIKKVEEPILEVKEQPKKKDFEETYQKLDNEINSLLPKKDFLDGELLEDIDDLSLDKTQKIDISDIPDLDDVDLPKIKDLKDDTEDIWKF